MEREIRPPKEQPLPVPEDAGRQKRDWSEFVRQKRKVLPPAVIKKRDKQGE
jgi:hypothetical protein